MFLNMLCLLISGCSNFVIFYFPRKKAQIFNTCSNSDPATDIQTSYREGYIDIFSLILFILINARIAVYKFRKKNPGQKFSLLESSSILNLTSLILNLISFVLLSILSSKVNNMTLDEMNQYPNYLLVHSLQLLGCPVLCNVILGLQFVRHKSLRKFVFNYVKEMFLMIYF